MTNLISTLALSLALLTTGCQTLMTAGPTTGDQAGEALTVQVRPAGRKPKNIHLPLVADMRLSDVVQSSKVSFRNKIAYIVRTSPKTGERHRLEGSFDASRRVTMETDYAIQPGDRVVIAQDTTTSFDRVMRAVLGRS